MAEFANVVFPIGRAYGSALPERSDTSVMIFKTHPLAQSRRKSATTLIKVLLKSNSPEVLPGHIRELLDAMLWKITEADGKYKTRHQSLGAFQCGDKKLLRHEHVYPKEQMIKALLKATPEQVDGILETAVGCTVTLDEHFRLHKFDEEDGWERYRKAGIAVTDTETGQRTV